MELLFKSFDFHLHSLNGNASNRLFFLTFFAVAFALPIFGVFPAAAADQTEQQDAELNLSVLAACESKTLDDVPPDPVSSFFAFTSKLDLISNLVL